MNFLIVSDRHEAKSSTDYLVNALVRNFKASVIWSKKSSERITFLDRVANKLNLEFDKSGINRRLLNELSSNSYDVVFIFKGNRLYPSTLREIKRAYPNTKLISWSGDNMSKWHNKSYFYHFGINYYDALFSVNIPSYRSIEKTCSKPVFYIDKRADKYFHIPRNPERLIFNYDVLFIGSYEKDRFSTLNYLALNGVKINIFGAMWDRHKGGFHSNLNIHFRELTGHDYTAAISESKITLGFLRKVNSDTQTSRTFEIPACGGFMLMERTQEHLRLFKEGVEAEFFENDDELLKKLQYYLLNDQGRENIAAKGYERGVQSGYYFDDLAVEMVYKLSKLTN